MVFSQADFLFLFLPIVLVVMALAKRRWQNVALLVLSLGFYTYGEKGFVVVMVVAILANYFLALRIRPRDQSVGNRNRLAFAIGLNLSLLFVFKYVPFLAGMAGVKRFSLHLPLGISFFTFQNISYLVDVYRGDVEAEPSVLNLGLYITLFPHLVAGPIVRYREIVEEIRRRERSWDDFIAGAEIFAVGLAKKVLVADVVGRTADVVFAMPTARLDSPLAWLGAWCYMLQIYYDFSGYSEMAIGLARMLGFHFPTNFAYPYAAKSIQDFWRRWHITLSRWFRDYVYIPLGGNRQGTSRLAISLLTVFFLCGLWHGANWTFVVWGLYHGFFLVIERGFLGKLLARAPLGNAYALFVILMGWVLFRAPDIGSALGFYGAMFGGAHAEASAALHDLLTPELVAVLVVGSIGIYPIIPRLMSSPRLATVRQFVLAAIMVFSLMVAMSDSYSPFLYFRF